MERKLTAILSADVKDYGVLVAADDEATLVTLKAYRDLMGSCIAGHHGRVIDAPGDNLLAEFASIVDAVRCAVEMQRELQTRNAALPADRRMLFRMGVTLGDVVVDGGRLYGDGVNIAARLESLAEPGGICLSANAYEQVVNRLPLDFTFLGEQSVKNSPRPIAVWRVGVASAVESAGRPAVMASAAALGTSAGAAHRSPRRLVLNLVTTASLIGLAILLAVYVLRESPITVAGSPSGMNAATAALPLPDKPSIVVLPFVNLSGDPAQNYLSDGITEDLTTDLAKLAGLFVISRSTAATYKGKTVALPELGRELGVRYVLQGSVQKAGDHLRLAAQLLEASGEQHLWAERFDRPAVDIFAVQDELRRKIVTALKVKLSPDEQARFRRAPTGNLEAYDYYLQGRETLERARLELAPERVEQARALFRKAIALDTDYAAAYAAMGVTHYVDFLYEWNGTTSFPEQRLREFFERALALDPTLASIHRLQAILHLQAGRFGAARDALEREVALHPNDADALRGLGSILVFTDRPREAVAATDRAVRLNPRYPAWWAWSMGIAYRYGGRPADALRVLEDGTARAPNYIGNHLVLAAILAEDGRLDEARSEVEAILRISPAYTAEDARKLITFEDPALNDAYIVALRKAGLP